MMGGRPVSGGPPSCSHSSTKQHRSLATGETYRYRSAAHDTADRRAGL